MRAVDTNTLVRLITRDDPQQLPAAERYVANGAWISTVVLVETTWILQSVYGLDHDTIATVVKMLLRHEHLSLQEPEVVSAALERFRSQAAPEFSDCLVLEIARKSGHLPLGTFDRRLARMDGAERP